MNTYINHRWVSLGPAHLHLVEIAGESPVTGGCLFIAIGIGISPAKKCMHLETRQKVNQKKFPLGGGETLYKYVIGGWEQTNKSTPRC